MITNIPTSSTRTRTKVCVQADGVQRALCTQEQKKKAAQLAGLKKPLKQIDLWKLHQPQQRRKQELNQVSHFPTCTEGDKHCFPQACL